jgi:plastocyanin
VDLVAANCALSTTPFINITGPVSGQALFTVPVTFPTAGTFPVVNPTFCNVGTAVLACGAKAIITVAQPTATPAPGATIIVIGANQTATAFPTPLVVTTGDSVWFRFDILAGLAQVDSTGVLVPGGLSCPVASGVGQFCEWTLTQQQSYYYAASPFPFGGRIDVQPNPSIPTGAFVVDILGNNTFSVPTGNLPVGSMVYFRFNAYGPNRVQRSAGPTCSVYLGSGAFDSFYQEGGRVFPVMISTLGTTYFIDPGYCAGGMRGSILAVGNEGGGSFVDVIVAPFSNVTGVSELVYDPNPVVVYQGGSVRWTWTTFGHTVTQSLNNDPNTCLPQPGGFDSGFVQPPVNGLGGTFTQQFNDLGTFYYFCRAHCNVGMRGAVIVVPKPQNVIQHGVVTDPVDPNRFAPPLITVYQNETACWFFQTAGDVVQSQYYQDCVPLAGGFNSGPQSAGSQICLNFTGPTCTAFYYYDSARCASDQMFGVILLSDRPVVTVRAASDVFSPVALNVTLGECSELEGLVSRALTRPLRTDCDLGLCEFREQRDPNSVTGASDKRYELTLFCVCGVTLTPCGSQ